ncbi:nucleoside hydrolase-like domain-containing protein [Falsiroseomonas sp. E2-1-a20]|uniref:nucleoside hydrolase-like domain-containing protein n=1 Tax=Falsiroseomonas sp. E2-1-a20 TaxID=3239300 RepID=UPI003F2EEDF0
MSNPRVFVTTDIGGFDKDDDQSMVHLLIYADKLDIVGLGSAAPGPGRAADIHQVIDVYARDFANLRTHSADYPTPDALRAVVHQGATSLAPAGGIASPTDASKAIIAAARAGSASDPLYVLTWGAVGDVAQALHDAPDIANKIRLISIGRDQQDPNAGQYLMDNWKGKVWWVDNQDSFRGLYVPEDGSNTPIAGWPEANLSGHGALGDYFVAQSRDLYGDRDGASSANGLKMGDAPTTLYLIDRANNNDPTADSWGGDFVQQGANYWTDNPAPSLAMGPYAGARTVAEDRQAFLSDFVARMDRAQAPANGPAPAPSQPSQPEPARPAPSEPAPPSTGATIGLGTTELDRLSLSGFSVEQHGKPSGGAWLATRGEGTATGTFAGADGTYAVSVSYLDEFDGRSPMSISVNGQVVKSWIASVDDEQIKTQSVNVALKSGDSISISGTSDGGEYVRLDTISVSATVNAPAPAPVREPAPEAAPVPAPPSAGATIGLGTTELDRLSLSGFSVEQHGKPSGGAWLATRGEGTATGTFAGADGTYAVSVTYLDEFDGQSPMSISVNGQVVKSWVASVDDDQIRTQSVNVALKAGDSIAVGGTSDWGEYVRFDTITVSPTGNAPAPAPVPVPEPAPEAAPVPAPIPVPVPAPVPPAATAAIGLGTTELDRLALSGFSVEQHGKPSGGAWLATRGEGTATGAFAGADGTYAVSVRYLDESDGRSPMSISVNGQVVKSWVASVDDDQIRTQSVNVTLKSGDSIAVAGTSDGGEYVRFDTISIGAPGSAPEPAPSPTPAPTPPPVVEAPLGRADYDLFAFAGQSNAAGHFYTRPGDPTGGPLGNDVFEAALSKAMGGGPVTAINVAVSGSGSNQYADAKLFWWDINADAPSKLLVDAVAKLKAAETGGRELDGLIWAQGEDDARQAHGSQKAAVVNRMVESTESVFAYIRDQLDDPDLPIFIQQLGNFPNDTPSDRYEAIRGGQAQIIAEDPYTYMGATTTDLNQHHPDNVHYSNAEYGVIANRLAAGVSDVLIG